MAGIPPHYVQAGSSRVGMMPSYPATSALSASRPNNNSGAYPDEYKILFGHDCVPSKLPAAVRQLIVRIFEVAVIDDVDKRMRHKSQHLLLALGNSDQDITYNIIDQTRRECQREKLDTNPDPIDVFYKHLNCQIEPLETESDEYKMIQQYFNDGYANHRNPFSHTQHSPCSPLLQYVFRLNRNGEHARFMQNSHGRSSDPQLLWHGSPMTNFGGILSQGLRIAPKGVHITGAAHGQGIYFSDSTVFSSTYTRYDTTRGIGLFLVCEVADAKRATRQNRVLNARRDFRDAGVAIPTGVSDGGAIYVAPSEAQVKMRYLVQVGYANRQASSLHAAVQQNSMFSSFTPPMRMMRNPQGGNLSIYGTMPSISNDAGHTGKLPVLLKRSELAEMGLATRKLTPKTKSPCLPKSAPNFSAAIQTKKDEAVFNVKRDLVHDDDDECRMVAVVCNNKRKGPTQAEMTKNSSPKRNHTDSGVDKEEEDDDDDVLLLDGDDYDDYGFEIGDSCAAGDG